MTRMLVTDLDNTLYDWVTFYATAFQAMVDDLAQLLSVDQRQLFDEFKAVHQKYHNIEQPFAALEIPSVRERYGDLPRHELTQRLNRPFHAFNKARKRTLHLYPSVRETLERLVSCGIRVVGFTEAMPANSHYRLSQQLGIGDLFARLYAVEGFFPGHPVSERNVALAPPPDAVRLIPRENRKPSPKALLGICEREGISPQDTWYIGDSIAKDIAMAKDAGVTAIWAKYGTEYDPSLWATLVAVTHWTKEDADREAEQRRFADSIGPDYTVASFGELLALLGPLPQ